jgi:hypothetical protein
MHGGVPYMVISAVVRGSHLYRLADGVNGVLKMKGKEQGEDEDFHFFCSSVVPGPFQS